MVDVATLVPSTRDFLQAIASHKKRLVLVPLVERADDVEALAAEVTAFAVASPGPVMSAAGEAAGTLPILSLAPVTSADDSFVARASGADAVVIEAFDAPRWNSLAKDAFSTRMASLARVTDDASATFAATTAARGAYLRAEAVSDVLALVRKLGSMRIVAHLPSVDETALRALRGVVDAAIVESDLYLSTSFATLHEELDP